MKSFLQSLIGAPEIFRKLCSIEERIQKLMSQITDWAAKEQADLSAISATLDTVVLGIANLDQMIQNFQNSPGPLSAADVSALDQIAAASEALKAKASAISVAPPAGTLDTGVNSTSSGT